MPLFLTVRPRCSRAVGGYFGQMFLKVRPRSSRGVDSVIRIRVSESSLLRYSSILALTKPSRIVSVVEGSSSDGYISLDQTPTPGSFQRIRVDSL